MRNWKTTTTGVLAIVIAVAGGAKTYLATGQVPDIAALAAAVMAGWGLIVAKDNNARL
jgi:UDP-N-acetylmuramate-alanine ligase